MLSSGPPQQRLTRRALALVLAGGRGSRLKQLTDRRAKPAVFFGGKFRIIDFALSNCLNSGLRRIADHVQPGHLRPLSTPSLRAARALLWTRPRANASWNATRPLPRI